MADQAWVKVQQKTFTKWMNNHLRKKGFEAIEDAQTVFATGIKLMEVVNALYDLPLPKYNPNPKMRPHMFDNLQMAMNMVEAAEIKTNFLKTTHLADGDLKMILGMMWAIILDYAIKGISVDELTAKEGLLLWVQKKTKNYNHVDPPTVKNFHKDWKNGMALCALIHRHRPNLIDYDSLEPANDRENVELAFQIAERDLEIPRLLDVEDLCDAVRPDERSVMTYVSEFFHRFAAEDMKEQAARRVQKFMNFMRQMEQLQFDYERRARALIAWCGECQARFTDVAFGDSLEEAVQHFNQLKEFLVNEKPPMLGERLDVEALLAEINTELTVNGRPTYVPPEDCNPDAVMAAFDALASCERTHGAGVRDNRFRFVEKHEDELPQEKVDEINASFAHFDKDSTGTLDRIEFKAALSALGVSFPDDAAMQKVFNEVSQGGETINREQYFDYNRRLMEDKDSPDQVLASFQMMSDQGETISADQLNMPPLSAEDQQYLLEKMPKSEDGNLDYQAFVQQSFAQ